MPDPLISLGGFLDRIALSAVRMQGWKSRFIDTPDGNIHLFDIQGRGHLPPILLLHGLGSRSADYALLIRRLKGLTRRLIVPDVPGHGLSRIPEGGLNPEMMESSLLAAIDEVLDEPAIVIGNSMGGLAAIRFAGARPERVAAMVLASPGGAPMDEHGLRDLLSVFKMKTHREALHFVDRMLGRPSLIRHLLAVGVRGRMNGRGPRELMSKITPKHMLTAAELEGIKAPTLLFWGAEDEVLPIRGLDFFRRHLPQHAVIESPERFGHSPFVDDLRGFSRRVETFLKETL
ncbi:MAG: pimeloyl-ACP methyl ester carboxylesterase [Myxococcota bacterium]|jgi:pimeloyl-ACP methyl ester carboxylesterase